ncbi:MAG: hypothetical protein ACREA7_04345 [Nitrosotalea sp.]
MIQLLESLLDAGIDHVMIINERGRVESMISKSDICLSRERQEIFFMGIRLHQSLLQEFDDEFGPVNHFVVHRRGVKVVSIPFGSNNLLFVMNNDIDHEFVIRKIEEIRDFSNINRPELEPLCTEVVANG